MTAANKRFSFPKQNLGLILDQINDRCVFAVNQNKDTCSDKFRMFTCVTQPLLEQRFQLAHVLKTQVECFKSGDGGLAEVVAV